MASENSFFKERMFAVVIGLLMIGSTAGYAFLNASSGSGNKQVQNSVPDIVNRKLTLDEQRSVFLSGRVLIENRFSDECGYCLERNPVLEGFARRMSGFVVLENIRVDYLNETGLDMIGSGGRIVEINNETLTEEGLLDIFCDIAMKIPKECVLREV